MTNFSLLKLLKETAVVQKKAICRPRKSPDLENYQAITMLEITLMWADVQKLRWGGSLPGLPDKHRTSARGWEAGKWKT